MNSIPNQLWQHPGKRRYYRLQVMTDLFGELYLIRSRGSLDTTKWNYKTELLSDWREIQIRLARISFDLPTTNAR